MVAEREAMSSAIPRDGCLMVGQRGFSMEEYDILDEALSLAQLFSYLVWCLWRSFNVKNLEDHHNVYLFICALLT